MDVPFLTYKRVKKADDMIKKITLLIALLSAAFGDTISRIPLFKVIKKCKYCKTKCMLCRNIVGTDLFK